MPNVKKICLTVDFRRMAIPHQRVHVEANLGWLSCLFQSAVERATGGSLEVFRPRLEREVSVEEWCAHFAESEAYRPQVDAIQSDLVIGFEMGPGLKKALDEASILWIDLNVHPIRFLDDLAFGITASAPDLIERIYAWAIPEESAFTAAALIRARATRNRTYAIAQDAPRDEGPTLLVALQSPVDGSRILKGAIAGDSLIEEELERIQDRFDRIIVRPHPFARESASSYPERFKNCIVSQENIYWQMSAPEITDFLTISSGSGWEARFFGPKTQFLMDPWVKPAWTIEEAALGGSMPVSAPVLLPSFWSHVLLSEPPLAGSRPTIAFNKLRISINATWGYNEVDTDFFVDVSHANAKINQQLAAQGQELLGLRNELRAFREALRTATLP